MVWCPTWSKNRGRYLLWSRWNVISTIYCATYHCLQRNLKRQLSWDFVVREARSVVWLVLGFGFAAFKCKFSVLKCAAWQLYSCWKLAVCAVVVWVLRAAAAAVAKVSSTKIQHGSRSYNVILVARFSVWMHPHFHCHPHFQQEYSCHSAHFKTENLYLKAAKSSTSFFD